MSDTRDKTLLSVERQVHESLNGIEHWHKWRYLQTLEYIKKKTVLDVGCYGGYLYDYLKKKLGNIYYTGLDTNEDVVEAAALIHNKCKDAIFMYGDVLNLSKILPKNYFDIVCCHRVTIHLPYFEQILLNLLDLTKDILHVVLLLGEKDYCEKILETNCVTGKVAFYYRRYVSGNTINDILKKLPVNYVIQTHSDSSYASLFIYK